MTLSLNLLDEIREAARLRNCSYQQDITMTYNKKVRTRTFQQGDWVLRRVEKATRKLAPGWEGPYKVIEVRGAVAYMLQDSKGKIQPKQRDSTKAKVSKKTKEKSFRKKAPPRIATPRQISGPGKKFPTAARSPRTGTDVSDTLLQDPSAPPSSPAIPS
ncbi:hypothetical protein YC2023_098903 [Brassica napus]